MKRLFAIMFAGFAWAGPALAIEAINHPDPDQYTGLVKTRLEEARKAFEMARRQNPSLDSEDYGDLAKTYDANDLTDPAAQAYRNAMELAPYDGRWPYYLAQLAHKQGEFKSAESYYRGSLKLNPDYIPAHTRLAVALIELGQLLPAKEELESMLTRWPRVAVAHAELGRVLLQMGDFQGALDHLLAAMEIQPNASRLNHQIGIALRGLGRIEEAKARLERAGEGELVLPDRLTEAMRLRSGSAHYWNNLAARTLQVGDVENAIMMLQTAVAADPDNVYTHATLATTLARLGQGDEALALLTEYHSRHPGEAVGLYVWGLILSFLDRDSEALVRFESAYTASPDMVEPVLQSAHASMRLERYAQAEGLYARAEKLLPNDVSVSLHRSVALFAAGRCRDAMDTLVLSVPLAPENGDLLRTYSRVAAGCPQATDKERENALNASRNLYRLSQDLYTIDVLALVEAAHDRYEEAETLLVEALFRSMSGGHENEVKFLQQRLESVRKQTIISQPWPQDHPLMRPPRTQLTARPNASR